MFFSFIATYRFTNLMIHGIHSANIITEIQHPSASFRKPFNFLNPPSLLILLHFSVNKFHDLQYFPFNIYLHILPYKLA